MFLLDVRPGAGTAPLCKFACDSADTFKEVRDELIKKQEVAAKVVKGYVTSLSNDAKAVISNPTIEQYKGGSGKGFHQGVRGLSAALALQTAPALKKFQAERNPFALDSFLPKEEKEVEPKVIEVLTKLKEL